MRRILIIILIVAAVWAGVWFFYVRPREQAIAPVPAVLQPFFPAAKPSTGSFGTDDTPDASQAPAAAVSPFKQLTARAVAGITAYTVSTKVSTPSADPKGKPTVQTIVDHYVRYVSRANGYVYEIKDSGIPLQVSNVFIPNVYEASFADSNNTAIVRFLRQDNETIATYSIPVPILNADGTRTQKSGVYLPDNIAAIAVSPDQKQLVRITTDKNGGIVTTSNSSGTGSKIILRSPFESWLPQWTAKGVYLQTKAAAIADGFLYSIDQSTARLRRVTGMVSGLTTSVSPSGTYVLYSESSDTSFTTKIFNTKTNATSTINLALLPEKCTWLQNEDLICAGNNTVAPATYPDAWYAGTLHFSDQLYHITTASNVYDVLYDGQAASYDMTSLHADEDNHLLYFVDKTTGMLWQYKY